MYEHNRNMDKFYRNKRQDNKYLTKRKKHYRNKIFNERTEEEDKL